MNRWDRGVPLVSRMILLIEMDDGSRMAYEIGSVREAVITHEPEYDGGDLLINLRGRPSRTRTTISASGYDWHSLWLAPDADIWDSAEQPGIAPAQPAIGRGDV